jgi:hypothetical protein
MTFNKPAEANSCVWSSLRVEGGAVLNQTGCQVGQVLPVDLRADFNHDGKVDGLDYLLWQRGAGDANGDSKTDGLDFLIWQSTQTPR